MAWSKNVTIWCDANPGPIEIGERREPYPCWAFYEAGGLSWVDKARKEARHYGWSYQGGVDLCPEHTQEKRVR